MKYQASIDIDAAAERVWDLLTSVNAQNQWNTTLIKLEGEFKQGGRLTFLTKISPKQPFKVRVREFGKYHMVLTGGMPLGLFKGVRTFRVVDLGSGRSKFETQEVFSGPLVGLMKKVMPDLQPTFDDFARDLKIASEG